MYTINDTVANIFIANIELIVHKIDYDRGCIFYSIKEDKKPQIIKRAKIKEGTFTTREHGKITLFEGDYIKEVI